MRDNDIHEQAPRSVDWVLLVRFVAGESSSTEAAIVKRWLAEEPEHGLELAELQRIWSQAGALPSEVRLNGLWQGLQQRMRQEPAVSTRPELHLLQPRRSRMRPWVIGGLAAAGIAAVAVGMGVGPDWSLPGMTSPQSLEQAYRTARGQRSVIELADGSRVHLGVDSKITTHFYDDGRREVYLEGEAMFDVVHDERRPFLVHARNAVAEDLGTTFGIRAYSEDGGIRVVVVSGEVELRQTGTGATPDAGSGGILGPRDVGELYDDGTVRIRRGVDPDRYLAWTRDRLVFQQRSLAEIAASLERWYDVEITIADAEVAARRLTLDLEAPSLQEALDAVAVPMGLQYRHVGRRVTFYR